MMASETTLPAMIVSSGMPKTRRKIALTCGEHFQLAVQKRCSPARGKHPHLSDVVVRESRLVVPVLDCAAQEGVVFLRERAGFRGDVRETRGHPE